MNDVVPEKEFIDENAWIHYEAIGEMNNRTSKLNL
jgi:hypothetical protein